MLTQKIKKVLGVLDVSISLADVDNTILASEWKIVFFAIVAIVVIGLVIAFIIKRLVSKPVNDLLAATQQVSQGNLNYVIKDLGKDEIGQLASSFNTMTKKTCRGKNATFPIR